jgi:hypothetical protein
MGDGQAGNGNGQALVNGEDMMPKHDQGATTACGNPDMSFHEPILL